MKLYKYGIEFEDESYLCRITNNYQIDIELRLGFGWYSGYYDGNHRRLGLGLVSIYWFF